MRCEFFQQKKQVMFFTECSMAVIRIILKLAKNNKKIIILMSIKELGLIIQVYFVPPIM